MEKILGRGRLKVFDVFKPRKEKSDILDGERGRKKVKGRKIRKCMEKVGIKTDIRKYY